MKKHALVFRSFRVSLVGVSLASFLLMATAFAQAQDAAVVRLSFVAGGVQASAPGSSASPAVLNMPLFEGSVVSTSTDGQAEIEFADGSVARLTPNSSLALTHLQPIGPSGHTDLNLLSGLAYLELNVGQGQHFTVKMGSATLRPVENAIFRLGLDSTPDVTVMQGTLHVESANENGPLDTDVTTNQTLRFDPASPGQFTVNQGIVPDSWDQWNTDRDASIAEMSENQTAVRDDSQSPQDPGWNDLDYYGNWYPVDGYGDVWTPNGVDADWDPFGYGYWGNYSGYGTTWISGYPWGWLPYHCGAWNYFPFGWGWVPGGCGLGWSPVVTVWNTPRDYHLPGWPKGPAIVPSQHRPPLGGLIAVDRGAAARGPWGSGGNLILRNRGLQTAAAGETAIHMDGNVVRALPRTSAIAGQGTERALAGSGIHVGVPVSTNAYRRSTLPGEGSAQRPVYGVQHGNVERSIGSGSTPHPVGRPTYSAPARSAPPPPTPHASAPAHH